MATLLGAVRRQPDEKVIFFYSTIDRSRAPGCSPLEMRKIWGVQANRRYDALCRRAREVASVRRVAKAWECSLLVMVKLCLQQRLQDVYDVKHRVVGTIVDWSWAQKVLSIIY